MNNILNTIGYILFFGVLIPSGIMSYISFLANKENLAQLGLLIMLLVSCLMLALGLYQGMITG